MSTGDERTTPLHPPGYRLGGRLPTTGTRSQCGLRRVPVPVCDGLGMTMAEQPADPAPVGRLASISVDTTDPAALADFYARLLGMHRIFERPDGSVIALSDGRIALTVMYAADHVPPSWPEPGQQLHLDIAVLDLPAAVATALALGAVEAAHQPGADVWRVLLDPAGHPFCLTTAGGTLDLESVYRRRG